jgi:hypothetical protein
MINHESKKNVEKSEDIKDSFGEELFKIKEDELENINAFVSQSSFGNNLIPENQNNNNNVQLLKKFQHPKVPPSNYICHRCNKTGHCKLINVNKIFFRYTTLSNKWRHEIQYKKDKETNRDTKELFEGDRRGQRRRDIDVTRW